MKFSKYISKAVTPVMALFQKQHRLPFKQGYDNLWSFRQESAADSGTAQSGRQQHRNQSTVSTSHNVPSDIMSTLNCGKTKAVALLKELDSESGIGLIEKKNMGIAKASVFYVMNFVCEDNQTEIAEGEVCSESVEEQPSVVDNSAIRVQKTNPEEHTVFDNRTHACSENELDRVQNLNPNKNNINKTNMSKTILSINHDSQDEIDEMEGYSKIIKENIDYDGLLLAYPYDREMVEGIYDLILETVLSKNDKITIAGDVYPKNLVKSKFLKLNYSHVEYVIACLGKNTTKVRNIKSYLLASLFNAGSTISSYYKAEVNHDMPQFAG